MIDEEKKKLVEEATKAIAEKDRYLGILIEDTNSKYVTIIEGQSVIENQINNLGVQLGKKIDGVEAKFDLKIERLDDTLQVFKRETNENFNLFFGQLSSHDREKADRKDLATLEGRVVRLEEKV